MIRKMVNWYKTSVDPAPDNREVLLSGGVDLYIGIYDPHTDYFYDQNRSILPTPKYWATASIAPEIEVLTISEYKKKYDLDKSI